MIIVAVSGGVDSMCLLDYLHKQNKDIVIAHLNYQKRKDSYQDALVIKEYLKDKSNIIFEEKIINKEEYTSDNFQAQARQMRYDFFVYLAHKYQTKDIYVAHHRDDYLETYLFKKERTGNYEYYGIKEVTKYQDCLVHRPLLNYYKEDLIKYALENNIDYHEDSSNSSTTYTRNRIRKQLSKLSINEKELIYQEAMVLNSNYQAKESIVNDLLSKKVYESKTLLLYDDDTIRRYLFKLIKNYNITSSYLDEIKRQLIETKRCQFTFLNTTIYKAYGSIYVLNFFIKPYCFIIKSDKDLLDFKSFCSENFNISNFNISAIEYPYLIRSYNDDDLKRLGIDKKKFISKQKKKKIPFFLREVLPLIEKDDYLEFII